MKKAIQILNQAIDFASVGVMIQDINRKVVYFNRACEDITKWKREDVVGHVCGEIFKCHTSDGECLREKFCPALDVFRGEDSHRSGEFLINCGDGTESRLRVNVSAVEDKEGNVTHVVSVVEDIGRVKKVSGESVQPDTMVTLGAFMAELVHEIKNPLNAVNIQLFLLVREIRDSPEISCTLRKNLLEIVSLVQKGFDRLTQFVEGCVRFSKTGELNRCEVDINEMLGELVSVLQPQARLNGIQVKLDIAKGLPKVKVDSEKVKQAIRNILINGIEAIREGGKLEVDTKRVGEEIWISCHDTGPGIPDMNKDKIFDLFYTTKADGAGIGLSVAQNIIQSHGGSIRLEQTAIGSKFVIALPSN